MRNEAPIPFLGDYIDGEFIVSGNFDEDFHINSPSDLKDEVIQLGCKYDHVEQACEQAQRAFLSWRALTLEARAEYLLALQKVYQKYEAEIAETISRETGKPLWESTGEAKAMAGKITITLEHSIKLITESQVPNALPGVTGVIRYKPRGVMAVIGPFNFPAHLPNGHIVPALLTGNTVVFKPSEKTPAVGQLMAKIFDEAGFPKGVFNLVQGQGETGKRLVSSELVDGVLFTGSYDVGLRIKQSTIDQHWKILALEMGGKNSTLVWDDAHVDKAVYESLVGAFVTGGQRCSCTSKIILHPKIKDQFLDKFYARAKKLKIGHWRNEVFMGPLIDSGSVEKYLRFQEIANREGAECVMRGKKLELDTSGHFVTPSIYTIPEFNAKSIYQKSEIFGPNVALYTTDDMDHALEITNSSGFGLVMAIFSKSRENYEKCLTGAKVGLVNWNRTTNGASSRLPFGGMGKSGNDRPSGHFAVNYCTIPVSCLEDEGEFDPGVSLPGM